MADTEIATLLTQADKSRLSGDYEGAIPLYQKILDRAADHLAASIGLAHCYLNTGLFDESLEWFKRAGQEHPTDAKVLIDLAKAYLMLGFFDEGKQTLLDVLAIDPDNEEAKRQLSYF
jgi:tetratricopeptide (TPR) repeat protein